MFNVQGSSVALLFGGSLLGDVVYEDGAGEKQSNEEHFAGTYRTYVYIRVRRHTYLGELPAPSSPAGRRRCACRALAEAAGSEGGWVAGGGDLHRDTRAFYVLAFFFLPLTAPRRVYPPRKLNYICKHGKTGVSGSPFPPVSGSCGEMEPFMSHLSLSDGGIGIRARENRLSPTPCEAHKALRAPGVTSWSRNPHLLKLSTQRQRSSPALSVLTSEVRALQVLRYTKYMRSLGKFRPDLSGTTVSPPLVPLQPRGAS